MDTLDSNGNYHRFGFSFDKGISHRAAIGLVVLATDHTIEYEWRKMLTLDGVGFYESRIVNSPDIRPETLAQMDVVIASVHTLFNQPESQMTERVLRAIENPYVRILGHPTGRLLLRREAFAIDLPAILRRASELGVAVEHNAYPDRLDLCDRDLRLAKELGCKISVNTDSHHTSHMEKMRYGIRQLRRAWLTKTDVLNTLPAKEFLAALRPRP